MTRRRVVVDTDPGIDDAAAIAYLHALDAWDLIALTSVAGNVPGEVTYRNARAVLALLDLDRDVPVHRGADRPLFLGRRTAAYTFGSDGLGGVVLPPGRGTETSEGAAQAIVRLAQAHEGQLDVIALGPLTNVAC